MAKGKSHRNLAEGSVYVKENIGLNLAFLKNVSIKDIFPFFVYVGFIFLAKNGIIFLLKKTFRSVQSKNNWIPTVEAIFNWASFYGTIILFLFYFSKENWLFAPLYSVKGLDVSLFLILVAILVITFANRVVKTLTKHLMPILYDRFSVDARMRYTINRLIYYTVMITAVIVSFSIVGLNWKGIAIVFSTLGIGIGFGLRNVAANFVSGLIILFEKPLEVGEVVEVDGEIGVVSKIRLRSTSLYLYKEGTLIIPNQYLIENVIMNRSNSPLFAIVHVGAAYGNDTEKIKALLKAAVSEGIKEIEGVLPEPLPAVRFVDIRDAALLFAVEVPVKDAKVKEKLEDKLRHHIISAFYQNKIQLADSPTDIDEH